MRKPILFLIIVLNISCTRNPAGYNDLKYSQDDLVPLTDSTKALYYQDAAYLELSDLVKNEINKNSQIELSKENIDNYHNDLLTIYNNSYNISDSFFENLSKIHTFETIYLFGIELMVDSGKPWLQNWLNGDKHTGINTIDSLVEKYNLDIELVYTFSDGSGYYFKLESTTPFNYYAMINKFDNTGEFSHVSPRGIAGDGSSISLEDHKVYKFTLKWGDCPAGCTAYHYWKIKVEDNKTTLLEEDGDLLE